MLELVEPTPHLSIVPKDDPLMTPQQVADRWGMSSKWVRNQANAKTLAGIRFGTEWRFYLSDVLEYERRSRQPAVIPCGRGAKKR